MHVHIIGLVKARIFVRMPTFVHSQERTKNAQFIIISLRNNMFEQADRLVGIFKTHDATKTCTIDPRNIHIGPPPAVATA